MKKIKAYTSPSKIWFLYQRQLSAGARIIAVTANQLSASQSSIAEAVLITGANILIFYQLRKHKLEVNSYSLLATLAALAFATAIVIDVGISKGFNLPLYISLTLIIPAIMIAATGRISPSESVEEYKMNSKLFIITGVGWALSIFFSLRAFQLGEISTIITLQAVAVILNVLAAFIFLKERTKIKRKIVAALLILFGVFLTVL